jgi:hypothetical protein
MAKKSTIKGSQVQVSSGAVPTEPIEVVLAGQYDIMSTKIIDITIDNDTIYEAVEFKKKIDQLLKLVVTKESEITDALKVELKNKTAPFLALRKKIAAAKTMFQEKIDAYYQAENKKRIEAEKKAQEERVKQIETQQTHYEQKGDMDSSVALERAKQHVIEQAPTGLKSVSLRPGMTLSFKKRWTYKVTNIEMIPRTYLMENDVAIRAAIDMGIREIDGIEIFEKATAV